MTVVATVFTKKPTEIHAARLTTESASDICQWLEDSGVVYNYVCVTPEGEVMDGCCGDASCHAIVITTLEGRMTASMGNWVVRGIKGEFYPCRDDIFRELHDGPFDHPYHLKRV